MRGLDDWLTREPEDTGLLLSDRRIKAKRAHTCNSCKRTIQPGEHYRRQFAIFDGEPVTYKMCSDCIAREYDA
jgi:hypothetical protein